MNLASDNAFYLLCKRLHDKVLESLLLPNNTDREESYSQVWRATFKIHALMDQASIVAGLGDLPLAIQLYKRAKRLAEEYEQYRDLAIVCRKLYYCDILAVDTAAGDAWLKDIARAEGLRDHFDAAERLHFHVHRDIQYRGHTREALFAVYSASINLADAYEETGSYTIQYFNLNTQTQYYRMNDELQKAKAVAANLVEIVRQKPDLFGYPHKMSALKERAELELLTLDFDSAANTLREALRFPKGGSNIRDCYELLVLCKIYLGDYEVAQRLYQRLFHRSVTSDTSLFLVQKWRYAEAAIWLCLGEASKALRILSTEDFSELVQDKAGWNIGIRSLNIMAAIEKGDTELAEAYTNNLRAFARKLEGLRERDHAIIQLFHLLLASEYDFKAVMQAGRAQLVELMGYSSEQRWDPHSYELINVWSWFVAKANGRTYRLTVSPKHWNWLESLDVEPGVLKMS